jgi:hypothetical protein
MCFLWGTNWTFKLLTRSYPNVNIKIPIARSKARAHNKIHLLSIYLPSKIPQKGKRMSTTWEPSQQEYLSVLSHRVWCPSPQWVIHLFRHAQFTICFSGLSGFQVGMFRYSSMGISQEVQLIDIGKWCSSWVMFGYPVTRVIGPYRLSERARIISDRN